MEPTNIVLYHTGLHGYVLNNSTYGTALTDVRRFTRAEAEAYAKRAAPIEGPSPLIPVDYDLLISIRPIGA